MCGGLKQEAVDWCKGKNWLIRLPLLAFFGYILLRHLFDPGYSSIIAPLDLGIHELGHLVFSIFGSQTLGVAGGTLLQLGIPLFGFVNFYNQRDFFALSLMFGWLSVNLFEIAMYLGDARSLSLPLVSLGNPETVIHDWEYMLGKLGLLPYDTFIAMCIRCAAVFLIVLCLASGSWVLMEMHRSGTGEVNA
jgi:hypothetical protein